MSPDGYHYKYEGGFLWRRRSLVDNWGRGNFSIDTMSAAELRYIAEVRDATRTT